MAVVLALAQAAVYGAVAAFLAERWAGDAAALGLAAAGQLLAAAGWARGRTGWVRAGAATSLLAVLAVWARFAWVVAHAHAVFGPETGAAMVQGFGGSLVALPWVLATPLGQLWLARVRASMAVLPMCALPFLLARPAPALAAPPSLAPFAADLWRAWAEGAPAPTAPGRVRVTPFRAGRPGRTVEVTDTPAAPAVPPDAPAPGDALLVELATGEVPMGFVRPGVDAPRDRVVAALLHARRLERVEVLPGLRRPAAATSVRFAAVLVDADGPRALDAGWAPGPEPTVEAIRAAVRAGAAHLVTNALPDGRFTYLVKGPEGTAGPGYNYPRHAGTAWFLARVGVGLGDPAATAQAEAALAHLETVTRITPDGRAYVLDPARRDGRSWAGTTALAVMARATLRGARAPEDEVLVDYVRQLAGAVDDQGAVRGEMLVADGTFPPQPQNPYGQGQVMLALAVAERHGIAVGAEALSRAVAFVDAGYYGTAHPPMVADEHWMCLASHAVRDVRGAAAGAGPCRTYVAQEALNTPVGGGLDPHAAPAGGAAEAVVAWAWDTGDARARAASVAYARHFLRQQYRAEDAPLLAGAPRLLGGFRDTPGELDVQIDGVQHIGSALLGVEALLTGAAHAGSLP